MGSTPVGGSENSFSEYFRLENASSLFTLYPSHQSIYHIVAQSLISTRINCHLNSETSHQPPTDCANTNIIVIDPSVSLGSRTCSPTLSCFLYQNNQLWTLGLNFFYCTTQTSKGGTCKKFNYLQILKKHKNNEKWRQIVTQLKYF